MQSIKEVLKMWAVPPGFVRLVDQAKAIGVRMFTRSATDKHLLRENALLRERHHGKRCIIFGAGSSIKHQDIKKLKGEYVLSVSNTFVHPDFPIIRPQYHAVPPMIESHGPYFPVEKFVEWLRDMELRTFDAEMFFYIGDRELIENNKLFKGRIIHWVDYYPWYGDMNVAIDLSKIPRIWSVSELAVTIAVYLGFEKIFLIGIDHDWFNGHMVYFYDATTQHVMQPNAEQLTKDHGIDAEFQMRRHAEIFKKYRYLYNIKKNIYNANADPNHYMDVFPKVDFETVFPSKD